MMMQYSERAGVGMTSQRTRDRMVGRLADQGITNIQLLDVMRNTQDIYLLKRR